MSYEFYKIMHIIGILMIFVSLGGFTLQIMRQGSQSFSKKKWVSISHGVGLLLALVGGFGLLARLGIMGAWPGWVYLKLAIWVFLGFVTLILKKLPGLGGWLWVGYFFIGGFAAYLALVKPF